MAIFIINRGSKTRYSHIQFDLTSSAEPSHPPGTKLAMINHGTKPPLVPSRNNITLLLSFSALLEHLSFSLKRKLLQRNYSCLFQLPSQLTCLTSENYVPYRFSWKRALLLLPLQLIFVPQCSLIRFIQKPRPRICSSRVPSNPSIIAVFQHRVPTFSYKFPSFPV